VKRPAEAGVLAAKVIYARSAVKRPARGAAYAPDRKMVAILPRPAASVHHAMSRKVTRRGASQMSTRPPGR